MNGLARENKGSEHEMSMDYDDDENGEDENVHENKYNINDDDEDSIRDNDDVENRDNDHDNNTELRHHASDVYEYRDDTNSPMNSGDNKSVQSNERRLSGRQVLRRNYAADTTGAEYFSDMEEDDHARQAVNNTSNLSNAPLSYAGSIITKAVEPLTKYFTERLFQVIYLLLGTEEAMRGWTVHILPNERGLLSGILDVVYVNNRARRFRNRVEVACALGLMPTPKNTKSMSREQMYLIAMEMREKHLISQLIGATDGVFDEVRYINDNATVVCGGKEIGNVVDMVAYQTSLAAMASSPPSPLPDIKSSNDVHDNNIFFAFGNVTVLNWGNIIADAAFHTSTQVYPIGFKCIRQEHDVTLDKIVECLCEVDSIEEENAVTKVKMMIPLFRLSVAWMMNDGERKIRVYEARSPQQAWQAAMLETEGVDVSQQPESVSIIIKEKITPSSQSIPSSETISSPFEAMDVDELALRNRICEERRKYFRALRQEQKQGLQAAVVPRLALDNVDSFADEGIMRLIEGMQGALDCSSYTFVDSREQEGGRRNIWRGYGTVNEKLKNLYKVYKKTSSPYDIIPTNSNGGNNGSAMKRKGGPISLYAYQGSDGGNIIASSASSDQLANLDMRKRMRQDVRDHRLHASSIHKTRNVYLKRLENNVNIIKNNIMKQMRKRREELKYIIGGISDQEYQLSRNIHIENMTSDGLVNRIMNHLVGDDTSSDHHNRPDVPTPVNIPSAIPDVEGNITPLPEPKHGIVTLDGHIMGNILEIWDYLQTFADALNLGKEFGIDEVTGHAASPDFTSICHAFKYYDPFFQRLLHMVNPEMMNSYDYISENYPTSSGKKIDTFEFTQETADRIINSIGIALTRTLLKDYEHIMGIELAKESIGNCKIIINSLTWREIARVVLISGCGRDIGVTEMDMASSLKGRGYFCTPETADKKALRLCRRRILSQYHLRQEVQESIYGFQAGICVRIPTPSYHKPASTSTWMKLIHEMKVIPDRFGWLIHDMIYAATMICEDDEVKTSLRSCLNMSFDPQSMHQIRSLATQALDRYHQHHHMMISSNDNIYGDDMLSYRWPTPAWDLLRAHFSYQYLHAKSEYLQVMNASNPDDEADDDGQVEKVDQDSDDDDDNDDILAGMDEDDILMRSSSAITIPESTGSGQGNDNMMPDNDMMDDEITPIRSETPMETSSDAVVNHHHSIINHHHQAMEANIAPSGRRGPPGRFIKTSSASTSSSSKLPAEIFIALEYDPIELDKLSIAMKRCHNVLYELIRHHLATPFVTPVDRKVVFGYYNFISQPISLQEIKRHLIKGGYNDHIYDVYCDVMILFENSIAFNPDASPIHQAALKLVIIFERLFYEMVLSWDQSIESNAYCHVCRQMHHPSQQPSSSLDTSSSSSPDISSSSSENIAYRITSCERCEACYHLGCLDPPVTTTLRTDWYCVGCIESRSIAVVHPNKLTRVYHPNLSSSSSMKGQVIGIEQIRQTLQFTIEFNDHHRELWTGSKVRQYALPSPSSAMNDDGDDMEYGIISLPSGYDYDDYDRVCGLARGYAGWGSFHSLIPAFLSDTHSYYARRRSLTDPFFHKSRLAIAWLSSSALSPEDVGIKEITTILRAIAQRAMTSSSLLHAFAKQDESNGDALTTCADNIARGLIGYESLIKKLQLDHLDDDINDDHMRIDDNGGMMREGSQNDDDKDDDELDADDEAWIESVANMDDQDRQKKDDDMDDSKEKKESSSPKKDPKPSEKIIDDHIINGDDEDDDVDDPKMMISESELAVWEHRRLSRRRGREDALASHALLVEVIREVDIDGKQEQEEIGSIITQVAGDFYHAAMPTIVKNCTMKPHEDLIVEEWSRGYTSKSSQFISSQLHQDDHMHDDDDKEASSVPMLCGYCGQDEYAIGSIFVWGQTWAEFMDDKLSDDNNALSSSSSMIDPIMNPTKRRGRYSRYHHHHHAVSRHMLWEPCYPPDAIMEQQECDSIYHHRELIKGSLPVHECCAEMMIACREALLQRSQRTDNHRVSDIIAGIGRGKTTSIGRDRGHNSYWVFCGLRGVFVCSSSSGLDIPHAASSAAADMMVATTPKLLHSTATISSSSSMMLSYDSNQGGDDVDDKDDRCYALDRLRYRDKNIWEYYHADFRFYPDGETMLSSSSSGNHHKDDKDDNDKKTIWRLYVHDDDIHMLMSLLDKRHLQERTLLQALGVLFPATITPAPDPIITSSSSSSSAVVDDNDVVIDDNDDKVPISSNHDDDHHINSSSSSDHNKVDDDKDDAEAELDFNDAHVDDNIIIQEPDDDDDMIIEFKSTEKKRGRPPKSSSSTASSSYDHHHNSSSLFHYTCEYDTSSSSSEMMISKHKFMIGDEVIVEGNNHHSMLWNATIIDIKASSSSHHHKGDGDMKHDDDMIYYKVSYDKWEDGYDGWIKESHLRLLVSSSSSSSSNDHHMMVNDDDDAVVDPMLIKTSHHLLSSHRQLYIQRHVAQASPLLRSLRAYVYLRAPHRESYDRPLITFSTITSSIETLRIGMMMIERALPMGAIDDSEDRWGDDFAIAWREAVSQAYDATSMMQVMIMLEYGVRTAWLMPAGLKLMSCLPSRIHCLRNASIGLIATKLWTLDQSIKYDKINYPKGHPSCIHNTTTTSSKSKASSSSASISATSNSSNIAALGDFALMSSSTKSSSKKR